MTTMNRVVQRQTRSVCPVCLQPLPAVLTQDVDGVFLEKSCPEHGNFSVPIWRLRLDFQSWCAGAEELPDGAGLDCPQKCGICQEHEQGTCCALLEVTRDCNLRCRFCFANGGAQDDAPPMEALQAAVADLLAQRGPCLLQLSGGEPTLRDDLPELVAYAKALGFPYVQLNSNGIRLAEDEDYVRRLAQAGLSFVFLQFDGVTDEVYQTLRGRSLLETKLRAIEVCGRQKLGVTLVPTVVRGINDRQLGAIVQLGVSLAPTVRGVHFQPVSYFGRYPAQPEGSERYTLDELLDDLCLQSGLPLSAFVPSHCDHPLCGFHGTFVVNPDATLTPAQRNGSAVRTTAAQNRAYVARHWMYQQPSACCCTDTEVPNFETLLQRIRTGSFTLTAMAFQDAMNLDIERLRQCSLHVYGGGLIKPFCASYLTAVKV